MAEVISGGRSPIVKMARPAEMEPGLVLRAREVAGIVRFMAVATGSAAAASGNRKRAAAEVAQRGYLGQDFGTMLLQMLEGISHKKTLLCTRA